MWGCTIARRLAEIGARVLVLEKRKEIGGNCRCRTIDGIEVHLYGSHIFHTSNEAVWKFISRFAEFNNYRHEVLACHQERIYHLTIGCTLLKEFFGREMKPSEMTDREKTAVFDAFIRGYTLKQWHLQPENVDHSIIARLKVRDNYSTDYFEDTYQGIPLHGYNQMFNNMLEHPNITLRTSSSLKLKLENGVDDCFVIHNEKNGEDSPLFNFDSQPQLFYSGPIDALFNYKYGALPWRSLRFETEHLNQRDFQGASVVNYTDAEIPYTRIHEFRHYHPESRGEFSRPRGTIITREYPSDWQKDGEPYYPINNSESTALLERYLDEASSMESLVIGGRLGQYKYLNMDQSVDSALNIEV